MVHLQFNRPYPLQHLLCTLLHFYRDEQSGESMAVVNMNIITAAKHVHIIAG